MPTRSQHRAHVVRRRRPGAVLAASALLVLAGIAVALLVTRSGGHKTAIGGTHDHYYHHRPAAPQRCPLTDLRPPGGKVPDRPAVAVKIGNEPVGARPQSGLNEADIVYDTPAEGFIMRYMAVYQCTAASAIGPTRSVRWVDWHIIANFTGLPILAFAGGITPDVSVVTSLPWLRSADLLGAQYGAGHRTTNRVPPDNLYTSTSALWGLFKRGGGPPRPVFQYSSAIPKGATPVGKLAIDFSAGTDAEWTWSPAARLFLHSYSGVPDIDALTGKQVSTTNIVVQVVHYSYGAYPESPGSTGDVESQVTGSGRGWVLRNGLEIPVTWHRPTAADATTFTDGAGHAVLLAPGRTWVEIVLDTIANSRGSITFTP